MRNTCKERKIGILLSYFNTIIQAILGFIYVPLLLNYMGVSQYGLYQLMGSLIAYFSIMDFGLSTAVIRFYIYYKKQSVNSLSTFLSTVQKVYLCIIMLALMIGIIIYFHIDTIFEKGLTNEEIFDAKNIYLLLLINIVISLAGMLYRAIITANEQFLFLKGIETIQLVGQPFFVLAVLNKWPTAFAMAMVMTLINLVLFTLRLYFCHEKLKIRIPLFEYPFEWAVLNKIKKLVISTFSVSVVDQIFLKSNQIILGIISGTFAVSVYSIATLIYMSYLSLSYAISGIFLPKVTQMILENASNQEVSKLFIDLGRLQCMIYGFVLGGFIFLGKEFIVLWAGSEFRDAWLIAIIVMVPYTIDMIQNTGLAILQAKNMYEIRACIYVVVGISSIVLAVILGKQYGALGCASATAFALFFGNGIVMNWCYRKYVDLDVYRFWKVISKILLVLSICTGTGHILNNLIIAQGILSIFIKGSIYTIMYLFFLYLFLLTENEKVSIRKVLRWSL